MTKMQKELMKRGFTPPTKWGEQEKVVRGGLIQVISSKRGQPRVKTFSDHYGAWLSDSQPTTWPELLERY